MIWSHQVSVAFVDDRMNLKINILIKEINANLDIFLCFDKISEN